MNSHAPCLDRCGQLESWFHRAQGSDLSPLKALCHKALSSPLAFVLPVHPDDPLALRNAAEIEQELLAAFGQCDLAKVPLSELGRSDSGRSTAHLVVFAVNSRAKGKFLDAIKKVLYRLAPGTPSTKERFKLASYGRLVEEGNASKKDIITQSFVHGAFYRLRYCPQRLESEPALKEFLDSITYDIPNHEFHRGPRCSDICKGFTLNGSFSKTRRGEMSEVLVGCPAHRTFKSEHEHVQVHFLNVEVRTVACEIPLWVGKAEDRVLDEFLNGDSDVLTGHIDFIRICDGLVWIWDYKPGASLERYAAQQVYLYARMLSCRTDINLSRIRCGYFDANLEVTFSPAEVSL